MGTEKELFSAAVICVPQDRKLADLFAVHLESRKKQNEVGSYSTVLILGDASAESLTARLAAAQLLYVLVSREFLALAGCGPGAERADRTVQAVIRLALERHNTGEARVLPVKVESVESIDWQDTPFAAITPVPSGARPISRWASREDAVHNILEGISEAGAELATERLKNSLSGLPVFKLKHFVDREGEQKALRHSIEAGGLCSLKGEGGIGKSTLAAKVIHEIRLQGGLGGGVAWIDCEKEGLDLEACLTQMAGAFFAQESISPDHFDRCKDDVRRHLERCKALVVFDSFEKVIENREIVDWIRGLFFQNPGSAASPVARVVITTRQLPGAMIELVPIQSIEELPPENALELLRSVLQDRGFRTEGLEEKLQKLCAAVYHLPLAIWLLGGCLTGSTGYSIDEILLRFEEAGRATELLQESSGIGRSTLHRHRSISECFNLSFGALSADAQEGMMRISALPNGAGAELARELLGPERYPPILNELQSSSVIRFDFHRYSIHPLLRRFIQERVQSTDPSGTTNSRLRIHAARTLSGIAREKGRLTDRRSGASQASMRTALDWFAAEWNNIVNCTRYAFEARDWETAGGLADSIWGYFLVREQWKDAKTLFGLGLRAYRALGDPLGEIRSLNNLGDVYDYLAASGTERQVEYFEQSNRNYLEAFERIEQVGKALREGSLTHPGYAGKPALEYLDAMAARTHSNLGDSFESQAHLAEEEQRPEDADRLYLEAERHYLSSLTARERLGDMVGQGVSLAGLGLVHWRRHNYSEAERTFWRCIDLARESGDQVIEAEALRGLGDTYRSQGRHTKALETFESSRKLACALGDPADQGHAMRLQAETLISLGRREEALQIGKEAIGILKGCEDLSHIERLRELLPELSEMASAAMVESNPV